MKEGYQMRGLQGISRIFPVDIDTVETIGFDKRD
jgi:hypothetical protein